MYLEIENQKHFLLIQFKRKCSINSGNIEEFKTKILNSIQPGRILIFNFENLDFIDSAGLTVLIHIRRKVLDTKGFLKIIKVGDRIQKLLQITRLHRVFEIYDHIEDAEKSIEKKQHKTTKTTQFTIHVQVKHTESYSLVRIKEPDSLIKPNATQFKIKILEYFTNQNTVILNFCNIRYIDSAGIASLIGIKRYSRQHNKKIFLVYNDRVLNRLFKLYSLDDLFSQFQTEEDAILAVKPAKIKKQKKVKPKTKQKQKKSTNSETDTEFSDITFLTSQNK